jgi:polyphosphate glucokinase
MISKKKRFNDYVGNAALHEVGVHKWRRRVGKSIAMFHSLLYYDQIYIGGGNAHKLSPEVVGDAQTVSNETGLTGGIHLWGRQISGASKARVPTPKAPARAL